MIQGPPGTGKTVTSAAIVYHMAKQGQGQVHYLNLFLDHLLFSLTSVMNLSLFSCAIQILGSSLCT